ncbi:hypothetical protein [Vibrio breoganii]|nr:hypothetical protein [Vibrio breoganii]
MSSILGSALLNYVLTKILNQVQDDGYFGFGNDNYILLNNSA